MRCIQNSASGLSSGFDIPRACLTEALLKEEAVEIAVKLTPPQLHVALGRRIIAFGKRLMTDGPIESLDSWPTPASPPFSSRKGAATCKYSDTAKSLGARLEIKERC